LWAVWRQGLFSEGCCGCGDAAEWNERAWSDAALLPEDSLLAIPAVAIVPVACAVACGCAAICAIGVIVPCVQDCWGTSDPVGCVKQCVGGTVRELPLPVQILCGACLIGCALCLVRLPVRPGSPNKPPRDRAPKPRKPKCEDPMKCYNKCAAHCRRVLGVGQHEKEGPVYIIPYEPPEFSTCLKNCYNECIQSRPGFQPNPGDRYQEPRPPKKPCR